MSFDHSLDLPRNSGPGRLSGACKQILNSLRDMANRPVERRRFAELSRRHLEDIGLTIAERDDQLR